MNQARWQRLKDIVADALEADSPAARTALLNRECVGDDQLLREAESYLNEADTVLVEGADRLEECAAVASKAVRKEGDRMTGRRLGAYVIVRELGYGGMATVYLAARADGYFEKEVAVKVLKPGSGQTEELLERFRAERELLASLDHPNIAVLFDAGTTEEGLPYFVMEYVPGTPVTTYLEQHRLPVRERLTLFLKICAAVEAAHRKRIVHRDLKRSNIVVNEEGEPKLLDFGIAKLLEESPAAVTAVGSQRLTPISASPEQARGDEVTRSSDIYALGALLYEMVTGVTPHIFENRNPDMAEVLRVVSEKEPSLPSTVARDSETQRALRGDLDAVIQRAMRKDPSQRYNSVNDLAEDVRRYLKGESVTARPRTFSGRLTHSLSQNRAAVILAAALLVIGVIFIFLVERSNFSKTTDASAREAIPTRSIAVLPFDNLGGPQGDSYFADGVQDDILTNLAQVSDLKVISRTGVSAFRQTPRNIREIGSKLGVAYVLEGSVRKLGDRVRVNAQLIDTRSDTQVWAEQYDRKLDDLFALQSDLSQAIVGQLKGKLSAQEKAAIESRPTADVQAYDLYLKARDLFVQYNYPDAIERLEKAIARDPKFALAYCLLTDVNLYVYRFGDDPTPARLEKARVAAETALQLAPNLPESHLAQAQYYYNGLRDYEKAQAELAAAPASPSNQSKFFDLMALTERRLGRWKESLRYGEKAWELDPHDPFIATEVIQSYMSLRRYPEAEKLSERAIKQVTSRIGPFWRMKGESILAQGEPARSEAWFETAPADSEQKHSGLAMAAFYQRDFAKALTEVAAARKSAMQSRELDLNLFEASIYRAQGNSEKARQSFQIAGDKLTSYLQKHPNDPLTMINLAWAYAGLNRKDDALRKAQQAVQLMPVWRDATEGPAYVSMQAQIQAWLGNNDAAITLLSSLVKEAAGPSYGELKLDPGWDILRSDPRYDEIVAEAQKPIALK